MAKVIFYLHAINGCKDILLSSCMEFGSSDFIVKNKLEIAVMQPQASNILTVPPKSFFLKSLDLVLEIVAPAGNSVELIKNDLKQALSSVMDVADKETSSLVYGYHRTFQESGKKPIRYHYLMYRRGDFNRADYIDYYTNSHYQFGVSTPLADYYQNYLEIEEGAALADIFGVQPISADSISELRFDNIEAYMFSDTIGEVGPAATIDETRFVNREICQSFSMDVIFDTRYY